MVFLRKRLTVIGITPGTNGKTTSCHLTAKILEEDGNKVGMATTTNFLNWQKNMDQRDQDDHTLSAWQVQSLLARMVAAKCQYAIIETHHTLSSNTAFGASTMTSSPSPTSLVNIWITTTPMEEYTAPPKKNYFKFSKNPKRKKESKKISILKPPRLRWRNFIKYNRHKLYGFSLTNQSPIKIKKSLQIQFLFYSSK